MCLNKICVGYNFSFFQGPTLSQGTYRGTTPSSGPPTRPSLPRGAKIKEEQERDESGTGTVRLYDVSTSGGRQAFLNQVGVGNIGL